MTESAKQTPVAAFTFTEMIDADAAECARWLAYFQKNPELLDLATPIAGADSLRGLLLHIHGVQLRYAEWLLDLPKTDALQLPHQTPDELFAIGDRARELLRKFVAFATEEELAHVIEFHRGDFHLRCTKRKAFIHGTLMHSDRHWAQVASSVREAGHPTDWIHDFVFSPAME